MAKKKTASKAPLTPREAEVMKHVESGKSYDQIARVMKIPPDRVRRTHLSALQRQIDHIEQSGKETRNGTS